MEAPFTEYAIGLWQYFEALIPAGAIAFHEIAVRSIHQYNSWIERHMSFIWRFAVFIVFVIGGLVLAGYMVWQDERKEFVSERNLHDETKSDLSAAREELSAARDTLSAVRNELNAVRNELNAVRNELTTERRKLGATVNFKPGRIWHITGASKIEAYAQVINGGPGIARIYSWSFGLSVLDAEIGDAAQNLMQLGSLTPQFGAPEISPKQLPVIVKRDGPQLSRMEAAALYAKSKRVYLFGEILFLDGNDVAFEIWPCFMFSGEHSELPGNPNKFYEGWQKDPCPGKAFNKMRKLNVAR